MVYVVAEATPVVSVNMSRTRHACKIVFFIELSFGVRFVRLVRHYCLETFIYAK